MNIKDKIDILSRNLHDDSFLEKCGIVASRKESFVFLNYDITSKPNKTNKFARGTVFHTDGTLAVLPFVRFFNIGEPYSDKIDWDNCYVLDKLDGTMISVWFDNKAGKWRLSTKRMVDYLPVPSFFDINKTINLADCFKNFFPSFENILDKKYWHVFEIVIPENRIVTYYKEKDYGLYLLAMRNATTFDELGFTRVEDVARMIKLPNVRTPKKHPISKYKHILDMFLMFRPDEEGVVVIDINSNRLKIKQKSYVKLHHIKSNISSAKNIIDLILDGEQEEVLSYFPEMREMFDTYSRRINMLKEKIATVFGSCNHIKDQKSFASHVKNISISSFLFNLRKGESLKRQFQLMGGKKLYKYLNRDIEFYFDSNEQKWVEV
jgi:hypothetical protein